MTEPLIQVQGLSTTFPVEKGRAPVVDSIDITIHRGEVLALVGESGCGKSMTALSILRLVPKPGRIESGRIVLAGREIQRIPAPQMRRVRGREISMIFQEPMTSLNPVIRVGDQVVEAICLHERVKQSQARERTLELFKQVGIPDPEARLDAFPHQLSGGIKQRVMIAMALSTRPKLLIADEPTTALDVTIQAQILNLLRHLQEELKMAVLLITHDLGVVNELADTVSVMYAGKIVEHGIRREVLGNPQHPYTKGLLSSIPALAKRGEALKEIAGVVPSVEEWPTGCRFSTRCVHVFDRCEQEIPEPVEVTQTHHACCFLLNKELPSS